MLGPAAAWRDAVLRAGNGQPESARPRGEEPCATGSTTVASAAPSAVVLCLLCPCVSAVFCVRLPLPAAARCACRCRLLSRLAARVPCALPLLPNVAFDSLTAKLARRMDPSHTCGVTLRRGHT